MAREATRAPTAGRGWELQPRARTMSRLGSGWETPALLLLTTLLLGFGLVSVYSASAVMAQADGLPDYYYVVRQATGGAIGLLLLVLAAQIDYRLWRRFAWPLLLVALALLIATVLPGLDSIAPEINGARRWLLLGPVSLQPSEVMKIVVIAWTAMLAVRKQELLHSLSRGLLPFLLVWCVIDLPIFLQPNLSAAVLIMLLAALVVFAAGARIGHFILLAVVGVPLLWSQVESVAYRMRRIVAFLEPTHDIAGASYQVNQSLIAIGSGGPFGLGFGSGQQKFGFLPEPHNDFIFAMIAEEWGFAGTTFLVALYALFGLVGYRVAREAPDFFGFLLAIGLTNLVVVQALLHMSVNLALVPTTGVTLPFISFGRSSLLVCLVAVGVLMNIARAGGERAT
ncbi:MAG: putative lipid II flippase FtsW [Longimicrobiales bacterium]